ncbi:MAG: DUF484 family protein [Gammaproteobacteria bacterium]|jgi:uncharacterized protein YigA (DUF484 family)
MSEPELEPIDEAQIVRDFLEHNPNWIASEPELLKKLEIHEQNGGVISLADRQLQQLRDENKLLKQDLNDFVANARDNEALLHKIFKLCIALLYQPDVQGLAEHLQEACAELFAIEHVRLMFFGGEFSDDFLVDAEAAKAALGDYLPQDKIITGRLRSAGRDFLFADADDVASVALVPMSGNETFGLLALGSPDEQHFAPENGDLFLSLFARTLSLWLSQNTE